MKRIITMLLALVLLISCLPYFPVSAAEAGQTPSTQELHVSEAMLNRIKKEEGFSKNYYWDYQQYSIGYGSFAGYTKAEAEKAYPNGITQEEAEKLLREKIESDYEAPIKKYAARKKLNFNQNQFDAMVSFTYNCGGGWTDGCKITIWIEKYLDREKLTLAEELDFVRSMGLWSRAGGTILPALCRRRINESRVFLYGDYTGTNSKNFFYIIFHAVESNMSSGREDFASYYIGGQPVGTLPMPNPKSGYKFLGWYTSAGQEVTEQTVITKDMQIYAHWQKADGTIVEPEDPSDAPDIPDVPDVPVNSKPASEIFNDVPAGSWYEEDVTFAYDQGLFSGITENTFCPNQSLTRAMLVSVLYRHAGKPAVKGTASFKDVPESAYYAEAVAWAEENGVVYGMTETEFAPNLKITREQMATILYRYCVEYHGVTPKNGTSLRGFDDYGKVHEYAEDALEWAVGNKLIQGMSETELAPRNNATRAQTAAILRRTIQNILD